MDEHTLHDDLVAISEWADPVSVPPHDQPAGSWDVCGRQPSLWSAAATGPGTA